jgi:hypothetical protein
LNHNTVGELVGFLALNSAEAPAYVGSSSGLSLAANLSEMVQATVWNQVLAPFHIHQASSRGSGGPTAGQAVASTGLPPQPSSGSQNVPDQPRPRRTEELLVKSTEPPNDEMGTQILHAYLTRLHVRYPFLDRAELWKLHGARWRLAKTKREELTKAERFDLFKLYLVYAIGATTIQLSEKYTYVPPEVCLPQLSSLIRTRALTLFSDTTSLLYNRSLLCVKYDLSKT